MNHRLRTIFLSLLVLGIIAFIGALIAGWPGKVLGMALLEGMWFTFFGSLLEGMLLLVVGIVMATGKGGAPPGSIGTEQAEELPKGYLTRRSKGASYLMAGGLVLLVGTSLCWGGLWL